MSDPALIIPILLVMLIMGGCVLAGFNRPESDDESSYQDQR